MTIEDELERAIVAAGGISADNAGDFTKVLPPSWTASFAGWTPSLQRWRQRRAHPRLERLQRTTRNGWHLHTGSSAALRSCFHTSPSYAQEMAKHCKRAAAA